jgi:hypothetical protein
VTPVQELLPKTDESVSRRLLARVDGLLDTARDGRESLQKTYVEIGLALDDVENSKAWTVRKFRTFDAYMREWCEPRFGKSRTQLYGAKAVAHHLLPEISKEKLVEIGISKAMPLAMYVKRTGKSAKELLEKALDPKVDTEQFRAEVAVARHEKPEKGKWFDLGGFFCTEEEREEIERGLRAAEQAEPLPENTSEWMTRKIVMQRMVQEFLSTWGHVLNPKEVNGRPTLDSLRSERP